MKLPGQPVEILIAISILVSAIHAIRPFFAGKEIYIAGGFGLVHGLAFASTLSEFGFTTWYMALTILAFNLGIELMQLIVVGLAVPWLILLSRTRFYTGVRLTGASFGGIAALGWIANRAFSLPNPIEPAVETIARHALWLVPILAVFALVSNAAKK